MLNVLDGFAFVIESTCINIKAWYVQQELVTLFRAFSHRSQAFRYPKLLEALGGASTNGYCNGVHEGAEQL